MPFIIIAMTKFTIIFIWGIILGIIYSRIHDLIPGKGILKGLIFGLTYYLIFNIRNVTFMIAYGFYPLVIGAFLYISPIIYGLMLGILYKAPKEKMKVTEHDLKSGIIPGAITGLIFGIAAQISFIMSTYFGFIFVFTEVIPDYLTDIGFIIAQIGNHVWINMLWYAIFGAFYAKFYDRIPGKSLVKGAIFGLIMWLIANVPNSVYHLVYGQLGAATQWGLFSPEFYIFPGLLLEGFYKKRTRAILMAGVIFAIHIIKVAVVGLLS